MTKKELFDNFQKCFGRFLTPFEIEDIQKWIDEDGMPVEVVNLALKEAVDNDIIKMKYVNQILRDWKKDGINTVEMAKQRVQSWGKKQTRHNQKMESSIPEWHNPNYKAPTIDEILAELPKEGTDDPDAF